MYVLLFLRRKEKKYVQNLKNPLHTVGVKTKK